MRARTTRLKMPLTAAALAAILLAGIAVPASAAGAKKKKKGGGVVDVTRTVGASIPDATDAPDPQPNVSGVLLSTIDVGKRFKGKRIRDVNVTLQTTGGAGAADDVVFFLTAPNGATIQLLGTLSGTSIGPLTIDDESNVTTVFGAASNPFQLPAPYQGTVRGGPLYVMDDGPVRGSWTLLALDQMTTPPATSVLNSWRLSVVAGRPYRTE